MRIRGQEVGIATANNKAANGLSGADFREGIFDGAWKEKGEEGIDMTNTNAGLGMPLRLRLTRNERTLYRRRNQRWKTTTCGH